MTTSFFELTEILTDATDDASQEKASIAGATLFGATTSKEEELFLKALTDYDELRLDLAAIHLKEKMRSKKENEKPKDQVSSNKPNENEKLSNVSPEKDSKEGYEKL